LKFKVAGTVEALGEEIDTDSELKVGDKVVVYPYEGVPHG
jgi:NADPH:quinone reductase-like Zn-dependent oxidoreductase